ncbi:MAG: Na+/H+ antiporter subunit E [Phenylobacterium sp.]|uniref:Na+/H+ antiporter subunit E n=1 Tax=Phenylobacterium sp. TaxID=1871053 RepID=UPI002727C2DD|nr:Na+/H+ antiporter subunit E [Phenylobacterium sp.]MDO8408926.1 Na+/H+ antiporter subunit E [Phenylobacterium sp.]
MIKKLLPHPALTVTLILVWMLLANRLTVGGLVLGVVIGVVVPILTSPFWPDRPKVRFGPATWGYLGLVLWDIVTASFQIAMIVLFKKSEDLRSAWLVVPLDLRSPEAITMLAGTISMTPGTVSCDVSSCGRALLVHALDTPDPGAEVARIKRRYEARLKRIFA